jgi:hypothetical protein
MTVDGGDTRDRLLGLGEATGSTTDKAPSLSQQTRAALGTDQSDPFEKYFKQFKDYSSEERKKAQEAQKSIIETQSKMEGEALRQQSDLAQKQAQEMSGIISGYGKQLMAPAPKREIDPQTKEGMMGLAALLPVAGAFFGGKGLTSATGAMQAMTGLVRGYQEGNKERIAFEQKKYDDAMKEFDRHQKQIREAFDLAIKGAQVNQTAAQAKLKMDLHAFNAPMLAELVEKQGIVKTSEDNINMYNNFLKQRMSYDEKINQATAIAKIRYGDTSQGIYSDDAINLIIDRYMAGDDKALVGLGTGIAAQREKSRILSKITQRMHEQGVDARDIMTAQAQFLGYKSAERKLSEAEAKMGQAQQEALNLVGPALALSDKIDRTKFVPLNKLLQSAEGSISDPELLAFKGATNTFLMAYTRAVSPTGVPTDFVRRHAYELLNTAFDQESYKRVMNQLKVEMEAAIKSPGDYRKKLEQEFSRKFSAPQVEAPTSSTTEDPLGLR